MELNGREVRLPPDPALGIDHYSSLPAEKGGQAPSRYVAALRSFTGPGASPPLSTGSYTSVEHYLEKFNRYTSTEAGQLAGLRAETLLAGRDASDGGKARASPWHPCGRPWPR